MKKILMMMMVGCIALFLSACSTASLSKMYDTTKVIYVAGKEVVITNADLLDDETLRKLNTLDEALIRVDSTKTLIETIDKVDIKNR